MPFTRYKDDPIGDPKGTMIADSLRNWDKIRPTSECPYCKGTGQAPGDGTDCGFCEADLDFFQTMKWPDMVEFIHDRVYHPEGFPEALCNEVERRFRSQDDRGRFYMLKDVSSSLWHHFGMTDDRERDCGT